MEVFLSLLLFLFIGILCVCLLLAFLRIRNLRREFETTRNEHRAQLQYLIAELQRMATYLASHPQPSYRELPREEAAPTPATQPAEAPPPIVRPSEAQTVTASVLLPGAAPSPHNVAPATTGHLPPPDSGPSPRSGPVAATPEAGLSPLPGPVTATPKAGPSPFPESAAATPSAPSTPSAPPAAAPIPPQAPFLQPPPPFAASVSASRAEPATDGPRTPPPQPPPPPPPSRPVPPPRKPFDWEGLLGVKLFSWLAGITLVLSAIFFLRYSIENGWITEPLRAALGFLTGTGLLLACEWKRLRRYAITANALEAAGIGILYATAFTAHARWHLIGMGPAFALMALVTAVAVLLAVRHSSWFIALLGLLGGFAIPMLLSTGENRPIGLFGYLLILNIGLAWVGWKKRWPVLSLLSFGFTAFYQLGWVLNFLDASQLPVGMGIFLAFALFGYASLLLGRRGEEGPPSFLFTWSARCAALLPTFFGLYLAASPELGGRWDLLFGFVFLLVAGLGAIAIWMGPSWMYAAGTLAALTVTATWFAISYTPHAWPGVLVPLAALVLLIPGIHLLARLLGRPLRGMAAPAAFASPILLFSFVSLFHLEPGTAHPAALFFLLALLAAIGVAERLGAPRGLFLTGLAFTAVAESVWAECRISFPSLHWALIFHASLLCLAFLLHRNARGKGQPFGWGGLPACCFLSSLSLCFLAVGVNDLEIAALAVGALAALTCLFSSLSTESQTGQAFDLSAALLCWVPLASQMSSNSSHRNPFFPLALLLLGLVQILGRRGNENENTTPCPFPSVSLPTSLLGFILFTFYLTDSPDPFSAVAVLALLLLGYSLAALRGSRCWAVTLGSALPLSLLPLAVSSNNEGHIGYPVQLCIAAFACLGMALHSLLLRRKLYRSSSPVLESFILIFLFFAPLASHLCLVLTQLAEPDIPFLAGGWQAAIPAILASIGLLWGERTRNTISGMFLCISITLVALLAAPQPLHILLLDLLPFLAFAFTAGLRPGADRFPHLTAVIASVLLFFPLRNSFLHAGFGNAIGLVPLFQALCLATLLAGTIRKEPPGERNLGRLALVAGAALGFLTLAIPLQLDNEWWTVGWALETAALIWLYGRVPHKGLLWLSAGLGAAVFFRLTANQALLSYHPESTTPIFNWYLYSYGISALCLLWASRRLKALPSRPLPFPLRGLLVSGGGILLFFLLNIEISDFFSGGGPLALRLSSDSLAQNLSYTVGWALFALGLLTAGILSRSRATRIASIGLLSITVFKGFLFDLSNLKGLYRVGSLVGLAIALAIVALALQRFVLAPERESAPSTPSDTKE